jgi:hypothetical protein
MIERKRTSACILLLAACFSSAGTAQESAGQAEVGFQQYYLATGSNRIANVSGLVVSYSQVIPDLGLLSIGLAPAFDNQRFRTGDDYVRLKGLPWRGQYWTFGAGDFYVPGQLLGSPFPNVYVPQIAGRGITAEATHKGRTIGFFYGSETIANSPRVILRVGVPQTVLGIYMQQKVGERLVLGARYLRFDNDLAALQNTQYLTVQTSSFQKANTVSLNAAYTIAKPFKWYSEVASSTSDQPLAPGLHKAPLSTVTGPVFDTNTLTVRANYTLQNSSYMPLLGYYIGDRKGPFAEIRFRPIHRVEFYASASQYENNVVHDPKVPSFQSVSESAGASFELPARVYLNGQATLIDLSSRPDAATAWSRSKNQQQSVTISRSFARHNVRLSARDFRLNSLISPQRQRAAEIEDIFHIHHLVLGGGIRMQRANAGESRTTMYYRGLFQVQIKRFSAYANVEAGNDLQSRTLFTTNTLSTTTFGTSVSLSKDWDFQAEAYRNSLITELNPQSIFVLQGRGVAVPGTLAALNQWSIYFRVSRKFRWGQMPVTADLTQYAKERIALKGVIEGMVKERHTAGDLPAEGVAVRLDGSRTVRSDVEGRFRFSDVPEGMHRVGLATDELLADFDPGEKKETMVAVASNRPARADLDVIRLTFIQGKIIGPADASLDNIVIRIVGTDRYTTPDKEGNFYFYNLHEGVYELAIDPKSLPEFAVIPGGGSVKAAISPKGSADKVTLRFDVNKPEKRVRKVFEKH